MMRAAKLRKAIQIDEWLQEEARLAGKKVEPNTYAEGRTWYNWERAEAITNFAGLHLDTITNLDDAVAIALSASSDSGTQALIKGEVPLLVVEPEKPKPPAKSATPRKPRAPRKSTVAKELEAAVWPVSNIPDTFEDFVVKYKTLLEATKDEDNRVFPLVAADILRLWYRS